jgi:hypothetical protein
VGWKRMGEVDSTTGVAEDFGEKDEC